MNAQCDIIRDLLPLYADDVCSAASRGIIDEHLRDCPECAEYLKRIRASEAESELQSERAMVIRHQAKRFRRRSAAIGSVIAGLFMIPILICLIVNLSSGRALGWFYVATAGMLVAASLVVVPLTVSADKAFWTFCAFDASLLALLLACSLYTRGSWFLVAASASQFGLAVAFLPFLIRARPLRRWVAGRNRALLVLGADIILFANMMNMISLRTKSFFITIGMAVLCIAGFGLLVAGGSGKESK